MDDRTVAAPQKFPAREPRRSPSPQRQIHRPHLSLPTPSARHQNRVFRPGLGFPAPEDSVAVPFGFGFGFGSDEEQERARAQCDGREVRFDRSDCSSGLGVLVLRVVGRSGSLEIRRGRSRDRRGRPCSRRVRAASRLGCPVRRPGAQSRCSPEHSRKLRLKVWLFSAVKDCLWQPLRFDSVLTSLFQYFWPVLRLCFMPRLYKSHRTDRAWRFQNQSTEKWLACCFEFSNAIAASKRRAPFFQWFFPLISDFNTLSVCGQTAVLSFASLRDVGYV